MSGKGSSHSGKSSNGTDWVKSKLSSLYEKQTATQLAARLYEFYQGKLFFEEGWKYTDLKFTLPPKDYQIDFHLRVGLNGYYEHSATALTMNDERLSIILPPRSVNKHVLPSVLTNQQVVFEISSDPNLWKEKLIQLEANLGGLFQLENITMESIFAGGIALPQDKSKAIQQELNAKTNPYPWVSSLYKSNRLLFFHQPDTALDAIPEIKADMQQMKQDMVQLNKGINELKTGMESLAELKTGMGSIQELFSSPGFREFLQSLKPSTTNAPTHPS